VAGFGPSVFTTITELAARHHALDLSTGFPDTDGPAAIKAAAAASTSAAPFARELSAVYTRATIEAAAGEMEGGGDPEEGSRYLVCVVDREVDTEGFQVKVGLVAVEVSTGEVVHGEFMDGASRSGLEAVLLDLAPVEVILGTPLSFATEKVVSFVC
jgi:DNA mismatch repair protein MSH3